MRQLELREIQDETLKVLLEIDDICKKKNLQYYLVWGTLIGAIRNKGFIPWDDDLDIAMKRSDFMKLKEYFENEYNGKLKFCCRENTTNYPYGIPRISNPEYKYVTTENVKPFDLGIFVDIYPLDNYGDTYEQGEMIAKNMRAVEKRYNCYINPTRADNKLKIPFKMCLSAMLHIIKGNDYSKRIDKEKYDYLANNTSDNDRYMGVAVWDMLTRIYSYPKEWFEKTVEVEFEGHMFPAPYKYDEFLRDTYGDYMQLPPEEKRKPQHEYKIFKLN